MQNRPFWIVILIGTITGLCVGGSQAQAQDEILASPEVSVFLRSSAPSRMSIMVSDSVSVFRETRKTLSSSVTVFRESRFIVSAEVAVALCPSVAPEDDCNGNGIDDACELGTGDLNGNGILDECEPDPMVFVRGDGNLDEVIDISDALVIIDYLFAGSIVPCPNALDADDNEVVSLGDALQVLCVVFSCAGSVPIPPPHPDCGEDPSAGSLTCEPTPGGCP